MKIKTDFVTNSSSTSYILNIRCSGKIPNVLGKIDINRKEKVKENIQRLFRDCGEMNFREGFYYNNLIHHKIFLDNKTSSFDSSEDKTEYMVTLSRCGIDTNIFHIRAEPIMIEGGDDAHKQFREFFNKFISNCEEYHGLKCNFESFPYVAVPRPTGSGGWDGGDPMGKYEFSYQLMEEESKMGHLYIIENKIVLDLKKLGESYSLIKDIKENIDKWTK